MFSQEKFGQRLRSLRIAQGLTQQKAAEQIGVSVQALSKWENGGCLPDVYHVKQLTSVLQVSADFMLADEEPPHERILDTIRIGGAAFDLVEKPALFLAGRILYARNYVSSAAFDAAIGEAEREEKAIYAALTNVRMPVHDIRLSVHFWKSFSSRGYGFVREVLSRQQAPSLDAYSLPAACYLRGYTNRETAQLMLKEQVEPWELFAFIRNYLMPAHGFKMAENGAQEMEIFDSTNHRTGYAYVPVERI